MSDNKNTKPGAGVLELGTGAQTRSKTSPGGGAGEVGKNEKNGDTVHQNVCVSSFPPLFTRIETRFQTRRCSGQFERPKLIALWGSGRPSPRQISSSFAISSASFAGHLRRPSLLFSLELNI
ncbi:unnamed protein product [Caenorhabditis auriculariae]|uniref:Uncharacterized protein n=1 Tax=Caenorhabditis auriculariae TaxID=2777116 RepID=A0A8S1HDQ0_9PELO|nr:unnamed protein product [Caenorhabditis auriculariae]